MSSEENIASVTFKEDPLGTHKEENVPLLEANSQKTTSETDESSESKPNIKQACCDMGTRPPCYTYRRSSVASELSGTLPSEPKMKQEVPTLAEKENWMDQSSRGFLIDLPKQEISGLEGMFTGPVTSLAMECLSETKKSIVKEEKEVADRLNFGVLFPPTPQHLPVAVNSVQHDQLHNNCDELPSAAAPPLVQHEVAVLDGISKNEQQMQPEPVGYDRQTMTDHSIEDTSEEAISELEGGLSSPVTSPAAEVLSEVDESPDVDEKNLPDGSNKKLSYPQCPQHQPIAINYVRHEQFQNHWLNLPSVTPPLVQHNVMGCSSSTLRFPYPELLATPKDEYRPKSNLSNPRLPLTQQTSVSASSYAFARPPGWYASVYTNNACQPPTASWENFIRTGAHTTADRMPGSANGYNNNDHTPPIAGHKRPREGQQNLAEQVPSEGFPHISSLSGSTYRHLTMRQVLGAQSRTPLVTHSLSFSGSHVSVSNIEVNGTSQDRLRSPAPHIHPWFSLGQSTIRPAQIQSENHHQVARGGILAPSNDGTWTQRVPMAVPNTLYDPSYEQLGLPIDPILRSFHEYNLDNNNNNLG